MECVVKQSGERRSNISDEWPRPRPLSLPFLPLERPRLSRRSNRRRRSNCVATWWLLRCTYYKSIRRTMTRVGRSPPRVPGRRVARDTKARNGTKWHEMKARSIKARNGRTGGSLFVPDMVPKSAIIAIILMGRKSTGVVKR